MCVGVPILCSCLCASVGVSLHVCVHPPSIPSVWVTVFVLRLLGKGELGLKLD